jgi:membrane-associated phospholipid phosphatase
VIILKLLLNQLKGLPLKLTILFFCLVQPGLFGQNWDINLLKHINLDRNKSLDGTFRFITSSAAPVSFGVPVLICGTGLLKHDSLTVRKSLYIGSAMAVTVIITTITKYAVNRTRPFVKYPFIEKETGGGSPSFPSGHTSEAFALATSASLTYPKWYIIAPSFAWAGAIGYSRMDLGAHYPSDVLAGAILGAGCAWLTDKVNQKLNSK